MTILNSYPPVKCPRCGYNKLFTKDGKTECTTDGCDYTAPYDEGESIKTS
ncbi:MAG: hypothetical protein ACNFW9_04280 [Candidatus Kerfeldbacteria bacterium]